MASKNTYFTIHPALGGLDTASDPTVLDPNFLTVADNIEYREGGQRKKRGGTAVYSTSTGLTGSGTYLVSSTSNVRAIADFWRYGTSLTPTQQLLAVSGASIFYSSGAGKWNTLTASSSFGSNSNRTTNITLAGDYAVFSDGVTQPARYDQTTLSDMSTGTKIFTESVYHQNRLWYTGYSTDPSEVRYTAADNINDSTGADTGALGVRRGDGDKLVGLSEPFYGSLYLFKGPQFGSVHQLSGTTPSTYAMAQVAHGAPLLNARALVSTPTDIFWLSSYGIHSLQTTVKFGNVEQGFLSLPIQSLWRDNVIRRGELANSFGFWNPTRSVVGWVVVPTGEDRPYWILMYNYALSDPKPGGKKFWSIWKISTYGIISGTVILHPTLNTPGLECVTVPGSPRMYFGANDGQVYVADLDNRLGDAQVAYTATVKTPSITRFRGADGRSDAAETDEKVIEGIVTYFRPHGTATADLTVNVDQRNHASTVTLGGGGALLNSFILNTDTLGGAEFSYWESPEIKDRGRGISIQWSQGGLNEDMELFGYSVRYGVGERQAQEVV